MSALRRRVRAACHIALVLLAACGTSGPAQRAPSTPAGQGAPVDSTPPAAQAGALVTRALGEPGPLNDRWQPTAGICVSPPSFQLLAQSDSVDVLLLLDLPEDSAAAGRYVVPAPTDSTASGRLARLGVQQLRYTSLSYHAQVGTVQLERLDRAASGRFDVTLQEMPSHRTFRYLGVFEGIPVDTLSQAVCQRAAPDSTSTSRSPPLRRKPA